MPFLCAVLKIRGMEISWNAVIQGTTTGIVGSLVMGSLLLSRNKGRNMLLKRSIQKNLRGVLLGSGIHGISADVFNQTGMDFIVREVVMVTDKEEFQFNATGEVASSFKSKPPKFTKEELARLNKGEAVQTSMRLVFPPKKGAPPEGFVTVTPFTSHKFLLPAPFIEHFNATVKHLRIMVEYQSWTKDVRLLEATTAPKNVELLQRTIGAFQKQYLDGSLNNARRMFRLSEIPLPPKPAEEKVN